MTDTAPQLDPSAPIAIDLPCLQCSYNLRTLSLSATCPECGLPVAKTVEGDALALADKAWLAVQRRGVGLVSSAMDLVIVLTALGAILSTGVVAWGATTGGTASRVLLAFAVAMSVLMAVLNLLLLLGTLRLARREPNPRYQPTGTDAQSLMRGTAWGSMGLYLLSILLGVIEPGWGGVVSRLGLGVLCVQGLAILTWMRTLFTRAARPRLAKQCRLMFWGTATVGALAIATALWILFVVAPALRTPASSPAPTLPMAMLAIQAVASCAMMVLGVTVFVWVRVLLRLLRGQLGQLVAVPAAAADRTRC